MREAAAKRPDKNVAILLDTTGPEMRTGFFKESCNKKIHLKAGQDLELTTDYSFLGDETKFACTYDKLPTSVKKGSTILIADGSVVIKVTEIISDTVLKGTVLNSKKLGERKNCNLPGVKVELDVLQPTDINDVQNFCCKNKMDFVAASFVQTGEDVQLIRRILDEAGGQNVQIISKIENEAGMENFDEILKYTDGVMVARGDLGMEIPTEKIFLAQKLMIEKCNAAGKPVVPATQPVASVLPMAAPQQRKPGASNGPLNASDRNG